MNNHDLNYIDNFQYKIEFDISKINIEQTTRDIVKIANNCLMTSYYLLDDKIIVSRGNLWEFRKINYDYGYDENIVNSIRLFNDNNRSALTKLVFYFRKEHHAVLAKLLS